MKILNEFKEFAVKGDVVGMGAGIVIGAAVTSVVNSLVKDVFTPVLSLFMVGVNAANWFIVLRDGGKGGPYRNLAQAHADSAVTLNIGNFINAVISFMIVAMILFFIIKAVNRLKRPFLATDDPVKTRECPYCFSVISQKASRCPNCTSMIDAGGNGDASG